MKIDTCQCDIVLVAYNNVSSESDVSVTSDMHHYVRAAGSLAQHAHTGGKPVYELDVVYHHVLVLRRTKAVQRGRQLHGLQLSHLDDVFRVLYDDRRAQLVVVADVPESHARQHRTQREQRVHVRRLEIAVFHLENLKRWRDCLQQHEDRCDLAPEPVLADIQVLQRRGVVRRRQIIQIGLANPAGADPQVLERPPNVLEQLPQFVLRPIVAEVETGQTREGGECLGQQTTRRRVLAHHDVITGQVEGGEVIETGHHLRQQHETLLFQ